MAVIDVAPVLLFSDNYTWLVHEPESGATAAVDPGAAQPVLAALERRGWRLSHILVTHHHADHTGGILDLKRRTGARAFGARRDRDVIAGLDTLVGEGDSFPLGAAAALVLEIPGHTAGHIAFLFPDGPALFPGDTLFSLGCGRLFEGDPGRMWASLVRLKALPPETMVYPAHEYTEANARFARTVLRDSPALAARLETIRAQRAAGAPTLPVLLADEVAANPFLCADRPEIARAVGMQADADPALVFAELRRRKDVL